MSAAPPPNWYPDPHDQAKLRWWDGSKWTEHLHALVPETAVVADDGREVPSTASQKSTAPIDESTTSAQPAAVDQWATAQAPQQDVLRPFRAQDVTSARTTPLPDLGSERQLSRPAERTWTPPVPAPMSLPGPDGGSPPNRRPMIIGAAVIAVLLIGVLAFVLTRDGDDDGDVVSLSPSTSASTATTVSPSSVSTATTQPPATTATATTATATTAALGGTTFTDPTNVYRLRVAPAWQDATVVGGLQTWSTGTNSNVFRDSVNVLIEKLPNDISMDDYLAASVRNAPKSLPSFVEVGRSVNTVNGKVLGQLDFRSNQNIPLRHRAVVLIKGRNAIVVTYTTEPTRFDAESVKVQPYLTSVEGL